MHQRKPIVWFGNDVQPNNFFFRSVFRSWNFWLNTTLLGAVCFGTALMVWSYPPQLKDFPYWALLGLFLFVVSPYIDALRRHKEIYEHHRTGSIVEPLVESPLNDLLEVADNSMNDGLRNATFLFGLCLACVYAWKW
jgi:hypothetical protein